MRPSQKWFQVVCPAWWSLRIFWVLVIWFSGADEVIHNHIPGRRQAYFSLRSVFLPLTIRLHIARVVRLAVEPVADTGPARLAPRHGVCYGSRASVVCADHWRDGSRWWIGLSLWCELCLCVG